MTRLSRRAFVSLAAGGLGASAGALALWASGVPLPGRAPPEPPLIGVLFPGAAPGHPFLTWFREGMHQQGLVEGQSVRVAWRYAEAQADRLPEIAAELRDLDVRVMVVVSATALVVARQATDSVPIVMLSGPGDPVAAGVARSVARPGGNVTGLTTFVGLPGKNLELLVTLVPTARRLAHLTNRSLGPPIEAIVRQVEASAQTLGLELHIGDVRTSDELEPAVERARAWGADILFAQFSIPLTRPVERLPQLAWKARLPAAGSDEWARAGFLLSYLPDIPAMYRRGAWYVARILAGASPADLPIEAPSSFDLLINRTTLAYLGLTLPVHVAAQVTEWVG